MQLGGRTSERSLRDSTRNSLLRAKEKKLESIAFPAVGTGIAGFPLQRCAEVMLSEVRDHLNSETSLKRVEFVLFDQRSLEAFKRVFEQIEHQ
jgi:O-acetyl-ADP-ribose deacetylase (regulator of RNase III)